MIELAVLFEFEPVLMLKLPSTLELGLTPELDLVLELLLAAPIDAARRVLLGGCAPREACAAR
jgi:hypothetical protein